MAKPLPLKSMNNVLAIIMGGGQGSRLFPLTHKRSKPAVPLAGKYRIVDIPISNCINSGIRQMYVLTQFNSESLNRHVTSGYKFDHFGENFVHVLAAQQTPGDDNWYQGTADAVRQNLSYFLERPYQYFLILSGDQLYRMDFRKMMSEHQKTGADVTIATTPVPREPARAFGLMDTDADSRITRFVEKPGDDDDALDKLVMPEELLKSVDLPLDEERFQASMGIYLFNRKVLEDALKNDSQDFGKHIIPGIIKEKNVYSHIFTGYWEDIGTIASYYEANLECTKIVPKFNFFDSHNPIYTRSRLLPASKINNATIEEALLSDGCIITDAKIRRSIIGVRSVIEKGCEISDTIIIGSDFYNKIEMLEDNKIEERPIKIGENTRIHRAIVDKNASIGRDVVIHPGDRVNEDTEYCHIRDGIIVIPKGTVIPDGTIV
ncbi:MAG: glucose-1-phosphate adenylyltransferase [Verrucomicrobiales bacterium]|jgi:glucose-1-phosphate adenylyltransferase|nr:glucose-1-phosphate adenylyltransferase [Verrucomicrobiales bacterium]MDP5005139.1 glucose-1-phosphate adenylyltransferase [Verrucomicrobiales bacterium]